MRDEPSRRKATLAGHEARAAPHSFTGRESAAKEKGSVGSVQERCDTAAVTMKYLKILYKKLLKTID